MIYFDLFIGFLKVGRFAFGGGYGAIPFIREIVLSYGWMSDETLTHMIAVSESTPGPIMVNLATYVGANQAGFTGALLTTIRVVLPSFIAIILLMIALNRLLKNRHFNALLSGFKACNAGIILATGIHMIVKNTGVLASVQGDIIKPLVITVLLLAVRYASKPVLKKKITPISLIVISAIIGVGIYGV